MPAEMSGAKQDAFWAKAVGMSQVMRDNPVAGQPNPAPMEVFNKLIDAQEKYRPATSGW